MIKIGLVDDHKLFRKSVAALINTFDNMEVVLEAENGKQLLSALPSISLDIIVLDIQMPEMDGVQTCKMLRKKYPAVKVLIVSQLSNREMVLQMMELGAHGFFTKNTEPDQLEKAILNLDSKGFYFDQELGAVIRDAMVWQKNNITGMEHVFGLITDREMEIIRLACREKSSGEIADTLNITVRTVETHRKRIMEKTKTKNFIGVVLYALRNRLILLEELI